MNDQGLTLRTGELLAGRYRLKNLLGSGGMGNVYAAECLVLGRDVAVKILRAQHAREPRAVARFLREARAAAKVKHANVVQIIDAGMDDEGLPYIAQELLSGEDLGEHLERRGGRLSIDESLAMIRPLVEAMAVAHALGVVHRDLKPENVFLTRDDDGTIVPKLVDFGISKIIDEIDPEDRTQTGVIVGTPHYMAPEQIVGSREIDGRVDVWALGVMLFELMSGELPFGSHSDGRIFVRIALGEATPIESLVPGVPKDLVRILQRCLRRNIGERYPSAAELARDLRLLREGHAIEATQQFAAVVPSNPPPPVAPAPLDASAVRTDGTPPRGSIRDVPTPDANDAVIASAPAARVPSGRPTPSSAMPPPQTAAPSRPGIVAVALAFLLAALVLASAAILPPARSPSPSQPHTEGPLRVR